MQAPTTDKPVTANRRAFRTPAGVLVAAETLQGGTRLYSPILATWARVLNDRLAAIPAWAEKVADAHGFAGLLTKAELEEAQ